MIERSDRYPFSPQRLTHHLGETARAVGASFNGEIVQRCISVFDSEFRRCVVQMKAASVPGSPLYYRFFYKWERDLCRVAHDAGLMPGDDPLQRDILHALPGATRAGLDFSTASGLAKVWTFTGGPVPLDDFLSAVPSVPDSVRAHRDFFRRHGMNAVFFTASDFERRTMNVYFGWEPPYRNIVWIRQVLSETASAEVGEDVLDDILRSQAASGGIGATFSWDSPHLLRWCLYSLEVPYEGPERGTVHLPALPPRLKQFQRTAPTLNPVPQYNVAWSFGRAGTYVKLEKSYARDATWFLTHEMGGDLRHLVA